MPRVCTKGNASEDIGMADSNALLLATSAMYAVEKMGIPEGLIPLSHAIIYACEAEKSNSVVNNRKKFLLKKKRYVIKCYISITYICTNIDIAFNSFFIPFIFNIIFY